MNLFWFSDREGAFWQLIVANSEESARRILEETKPEGEDDDTDVSPLELVAVTALNGSEGEVATIFPHEVTFNINDSPGGELVAI